MRVASRHATPASHDASVRHTPVRGAELVGVFALVGLGAALRAHGFTSKDLWFDDAWVALTARVGIGTAVHMGLAAPGYLLALREWIAIDPGSTAWLQAPAFLFGVFAIPATWLLLRYLRMPRWIAVGGALLVSVMPILVQYSTRVKEYPFDFLAACALLGLYEAVRRAPSARRLVSLGVASAIAVLASGSCVAIVVAVWALVYAQLHRNRALRAALLGGSAVAAIGCFLVWVLFLRSLPHALYRYWRVRGYLFDWHSVPAFEKSVSLSFGGFAHEAFGVPAAPSFFRFSDGVHSVLLTAVGLAIVGLLIGVPIAIAARARTLTPALASAVVLLLALLLAMLGVVPFGDGRTDEVLYPAVLVCLAACLDAVGARVARTPAQGATVHTARAVTALAAVGLLAFGVLHPADYPTIDLRGLDAQLHRQLGPHDVVFVSTFDAFGWCYYRLSACKVVIGGAPQWVQGFRPESRDPSDFIATSEQSVLPQIGRAMRGAKVAWYVGFTYGTYDVAASSAAQDRPVPTQMLRVLLHDGWRLSPAGPATRLATTHAFAWRLTRSSSG